MCAQQLITVNSDAFWTPEAMAARAKWPWVQVMYHCAFAGSKDHARFVKKYEDKLGADSPEVLEARENYCGPWNYDRMAELLNQTPEDATLVEGMKHDNANVLYSELTGRGYYIAYENSLRRRLGRGTTINIKGSRPTENNPKPRLHVEPELSTGQQNIYVSNVIFALSRMCNTPDRKSGFVIDHVIEGKKHDNRKENLILLTHSLNLKKPRMAKKNRDNQALTKELVDRLLFGSVSDKTYVDGVVANLEKR